METQMQTIPEDLNQLVSVYEKILSRVTSEACATAVFTEWGKNLRVERMMSAREPRFATADRVSVGEAPASSRQIAKLKFMGVQIPQNLSKRLASQMIDEAVAGLER